MGTSSSYRAPATPRWNAFLASITNREVPLDRIRSELFNAGNEWEQALAGPAVASYADSVAELYEEFPERITVAERTDFTVVELLSQARATSSEAGFSPAIAIAERAFATLIISTVEGMQMPGSTASGLAARWVAGRGSAPSELVSRYVGELIGQFARHVVDREAGRLARSDLPIKSAELSSALGRAAAEIARAATAEETVVHALTRETWPALIHRAFDAGRAIPVPDR